MRYIAIAFAAGLCAGWFLRKVRPRGDDGDLPPVLLMAFSLFTQSLAAAGPADAGGVAGTCRRAWTIERQVCECRRQAFNGRVGEDTRALLALLGFCRTRWDLPAGAGAAAGLHRLRAPRRASRAR